LPAAIGAPDGGQVDVGALFDAPFDAFGSAGEALGKVPNAPVIADDPDVCMDAADVAGGKELLVAEGAAVGTSVDGCAVAGVATGEVAAGFAGRFAAGMDVAEVLLEAVASKAEVAGAGTDDMELEGAVDEIAVMDFASTGSSVVCFARLVESRPSMA
jgi:hypothetical protein